MTELTQLFPQPTRQRPLEGTYLAHNIRALASDAKPFVFGNFVVSLDGRISIPRADGDGQTVPKATANDRDWRLFQELAAQADLIISSGRYLRDWADGKAQEILQVDDPQFADLRDWRREQGLSPHPDIAIISNSLDFPIPDVLTAENRNVVVFTSAEPDPERVAEIEAQAGKLYVVGDEAVEGAPLVAKIGELGYRVVYSAAGPRIMHMLVAGGVLDRLYLTHAPKLLGGHAFTTILEGGLLDSAESMRLVSLFHDPAALDGLGQLFVAYETTE